MKAICLQENLKKAINIVERVTGKNVNLPILSHILIETDKGRLKISATDLEIGLNSWVSAKVETQGKIAVPVNVLANFISSLPSEKIYLEKEKNNLKLKCGNFQSTIKGLDANDFPIIPKIDDQIFITLKVKDIYKALSQVYQAASISDTRPEISGILFNITADGHLKLAATDSFRLAEKTLKKVTSPDKKKAFIIPLKTISELIRITYEREGEVKLFIKDNQILFNFDEIHLISRLIEGHFPDYERIIPTEFTTEVIVDKDKLIDAIKIAGIFVTKVNDVSLAFLKKGKIEISSSSQELGQNNSTLDAEIKGEELKLVFNYKYLIDGISKVEKNKVELRLTGRERPMLIKGASDQTYFYVVMPVRDMEE